MSDYGIRSGWYKYKNKDNNNGELIHVHKTTKKFVAVKVWSYYDNRYDLNNMDERDRWTQVFFKKVKVDESKTIYPYETKWLRSWVLDDDHFLL
tara:strand:- start:50 stop:331 length:282 start_codon:yes stop_codon:yes gene_type:complete